MAVSIRLKIVARLLAYWKTGGVFGPSQRALCCVQHGCRSFPTVHPPDNGSDRATALQIEKSLSKHGFWRGLLRLRLYQKSVQNRFFTFQPLRISFFRRQGGKLLLIGEQSGAILMSHKGSRTGALRPRQSIYCRKEHLPLQKPPVELLVNRFQPIICRPQNPVGHCLAG